jgi:hypothetical protein
VLGVRLTYFLYDTSEVNPSLDGDVHHKTTHSLDRCGHRQMCQGSTWGVDDDWERTWFLSEADGVWKQVFSAAIAAGLIDDTVHFGE